jgi:pSer/pThr/pTyr-binding forkhead associated (FHA) protein
MAATVTLSIKEGALGGKEFVLTKPGRMTIGRTDDCELRLPTDADHQGVSRRHCLLEVKPPQLWVRDLCSRNGTRINGMQIGHPAAWPRPSGDAQTLLPAYELHDRDELEVAGTVFQVSIKQPVDRPVYAVNNEAQQAARPYAAPRGASHAEPSSFAGSWG